MGNTYTVSAHEEGQRLDVFLSEKTELTRSKIQNLLRDGHILVNNRKEKQGYRVRRGDIIECHIPEPEPQILIPEDIPIDIVWEDSHVIVVDKPPGLVVHPAPGHTRGTLINALLFRCNRLASVGMPLRPGIVHRLDKDTSGLIVVAKDDQAYYGLVDQFKNKEVEKEYKVLVFGNLKDESGEIRSMIGRAIHNRKKMSTKTRCGREAVTRYRIVKRLPQATLVDVVLFTGRTHQIRVHFSSIGHPVLGDRTYGRKSQITINKETIRFPRQMLHACRLAFIHPISGERLEFRSDLPPDMEEAVQRLGGMAS
jgi:23S rRNA pseudouridine1911/1915/1917 synthase